MTAIQAGAVSEMSTLLTDLVWYWDLSSADATITDQHSSLALSRIGTTTTESTGGPDGGPCISFGNAAGKYRNASVAKTVSYDDGYTVNIWVRSTGTSTLGNWLINHRNNSPPFYFQVFARSTLSGATGDNAWTMDNDSVFRIANTSQESLNTWQMLTLRDTGTTTELYRNGSLVATSSTVLGTRSTAAAAFGIGGDGWAEPVTSGVNHRGQLAMAGVWNEPLSQAAITALYNGGNGRRYADLNIPIGVFPRRRRSRSGGGVL
jgi:hypothetical protein